MRHFFSAVLPRAPERPHIIARTIGVALALIAFSVALAPAASGYVAPVSLSANVQIDTRDPAQPKVDFRSPVVAINPNNSNNVVVASRHDQPDYFCHIHYSLDRGATWAASTGTGATFPDPPVPVGKTSGTCWSPGVAFDAAGNVYVVAQDRPGGGGRPTTVIVWKSTDGGKTFGKPVTIPASTSSGFSVQSDIAIDTTPTSAHFGRIYVTWHESTNGQNLSAQLVYSDDGGASWSAATSRPLAGVTGRHEVLPDLVVAPDGTVYDIFKGESYDFATDCAGIGFGTIPPSGTDCPIMVLRSSNGGVSFDGDPVTVGVAHYTDTAVAEEPSIVVTPTGTVLVATATVPKVPALGCTASLQAVVYRSTDRGQSWSAPQTLNDDSCASGSEHRDPRLSVAPNGRVDAAFYDNRLDPSHNMFDVDYTNSTDDGVTFGPNTRLSDKSFDRMLLFTPIPSGFQTRDYDTVTGLASTNIGAIAAWGDTRNDPANSTDVWSTRIGLAPPSPPGSGGGLSPTGTATPDTIAPGVSSFGVTNRTFVVGGGMTPAFGVAARTRHRKGTTFKYTLSEAATVKIAIFQRRSGRRRGARCIAPRRSLRKKAKCTRLIRRGTLVRVSKAGTNSVAFSGRLGSKALGPGSYSATITATDAAKNTSGPKTISFTVVKR